jgi:plastocyanin
MSPARLLCALVASIAGQRPRAGSVLLLLLVTSGAGEAAAQDVVDRSPNIDAWVGVPWTLHSVMQSRFRDAAPGGRIDLDMATTFTHGLSLPWRAAAVFSYAPESPTAPDEPDEIEILYRQQLLEHAAAGTLFAAAGWNTAAASVDLEAVLTRQVGPLRLLAAARWFSSMRGSDNARTTLGGGVVWHPFPRRAPISLSGDVAVAVDGDGGNAAWSGGVAVGIPHTALTLAFQVTNTAAGTLQGRSSALGGPRYGFALTAPVPVGYVLGRYPPRARARDAVSDGTSQAADVVVEIQRHAYGPMRIDVAPGAVVEWVNHDAVVHTATAEDRAWDSGAIEPGASWRARFDEPGVYPYYCGPHPYMKGVIVVR